jgi:hypothetical protein
MNQTVSVYIFIRENVYFLRETMYTWIAKQKKRKWNEKPEK